MVGLDDTNRSQKSWPLEERQKEGGGGHAFTWF